MQRSELFLRDRMPWQKRLRQRRSRLYRTLHPETCHFLAGLKYEPDAVCSVLIIPFSGLTWHDERFDESRDLSFQAKAEIQALFIARGKIWGGFRLLPFERRIWRTVRRDFPDCPILKRLTATPEMFEDLHWANVQQFEFLERAGFVEMGDDEAGGRTYLRPPKDSEPD